MQQTISENSKNIDRFFVYELWNPLKNEIFYVGKSNYRKGITRLAEHIKEAKQVIRLGRRGNHKIHTILKILREGHKVDFRIVYETDIEEESFDKERELISFYGRRDLKAGPLTNLTDGGEGVSGYKAPQWLRDLQSKQRSGELNVMFGKTHTNKTKNQISRVRNARLKSGEIIPVKHTKEWKQHLKVNNAGGVQQLN